MDTKVTSRVVFHGLLILITLTTLWSQVKYQRNELYSQVFENVAKNKRKEFQLARKIRITKTKYYEKDEDIWLLQLLLSFYCTHMLSTGIVYCSDADMEIHLRLRHSNLATLS
jgi:hypothetical protein